MMETGNKTIIEKYPWLRLFIKTTALLSAFLLLYQFVVCVHIVHYNGMFPAVRDGDVAIINRLDKSADVSDVVLYESEGRLRLGRVAAIESSLIEITESAYFINGMVPAEQVAYATTNTNAKLEFPYTVPGECVFILNDFREDASDSRQFGAVKKENIKGTIFFLFRKRGF
jgi:signal peptidase I